MECLIECLEEVFLKKLLEILHSVCPNIDFTLEKSLIDDDLIDSFDIVTIMSEISGQYNIDLDVEDMTPENFNSAEAIFALISSRLK